MVASSEYDQHQARILIGDLKMKQVCLTLFFFFLGSPIDVDKFYVTETITIFIYW